MKFGLSSEISKDLLKKSFIVDDISKSLDPFFEGRDYGLGILRVAVGIICVSPEFEFFFKVRKKYSKQKKLCEFDVKIDHQTFKRLNKEELKHYILEEIYKSFSIFEELKIVDFNVEKIKYDLRAFIEKDG